MEDYHYAGGLPAVMKKMGDRLALDVMTVNGVTLGEQIAEAECYNDEVIRDLDNPVRENSGIWVLSGNLCPQGAIIKPNAATPALLHHTGRAVVFESIEDFPLPINFNGTLRPYQKAGYNWLHFLRNFKFGLRQNKLSSTGAISRRTERRQPGSEPGLDDRISELVEAISASVRLPYNR